MYEKRKHGVLGTMGAVIAISAFMTACPSEPAPSADVPPAPPEQGEAPAGQAADAAPAGTPGQAGAPAAAPKADQAAPAAGSADAAAPAPPPPGGPKPGKIAMDLSKSPFPSQEKLKTTGNAVTVKGMLLGDECKGKAIRIDAITATKEKGISLEAYLNTKDIGHFEMLVPKTDKPVYVVANCDLDGDGYITPGKDFTAAFAKNPVTATSDVSAVVMTFSANQPSEGMPPLVAPPAHPAGSAAGGPGAPAGPAPAGGAAQPGAPADAKAGAPGAPPADAKAGAPDAKAGAPDASAKPPAEGTEKTTHTGHKKARPEADGNK